MRTYNYMNEEEQPKSEKQLTINVVNTTLQIVVAVAGICAMLLLFGKILSGPSSEIISDDTIITNVENIHFELVKNGPRPIGNNQYSIDVYDNDVLVTIAIDESDAKSLSVGTEVAISKQTKHYTDIFGGSADRLEYNLLEVH